MANWLYRTLGKLHKRSERVPVKVYDQAGNLIADTTMTVGEDLYWGWLQGGKVNVNGETYRITNRRLLPGDLAVLMVHVPPPAPLEGGDGAWSSWEAFEAYYRANGDKL